MGIQEQGQECPSMTSQNWAPPTWANSTLPQWIPHPLPGGIPPSLVLAQGPGCPQGRGVEGPSNLTAGLGDAGILVWRLSR